MTLYRIETEEGEGVYHHGPAREALDGGWASDRQPMPSDELVDGLRCDCPAPWECRRFAFPSLDHLTRWFDARERRAIRPYVAVSVYEAPDDAAMSDAFQATFLRCRARRVARTEVPA